MASSFCSRCKASPSVNCKLFLIKGTTRICNGCLVCSICRRSLIPPASIILHSDGSFYCSDDYESLFGLKCQGCKLPIKHGSKLLTVSEDIKWHPECFKCGDCGKPLNGKYHLASDGLTPLCSNDYTKRNGPKCDCCSKSMKKWMIVNDLTLCQPCFKGSGPCACCRSIITPTLDKLPKSVSRQNNTSFITPKREKICSKCAQTGIVDNEEAHILLKEVKQVLVSYGLSLFEQGGVADKIKVKLLSEDEMDTYQKKFPSLGHGKAPLGFTLTQQQSTITKQHSSSSLPDLKMTDIAATSKATRTIQSSSSLPLMNSSSNYQQSASVTQTKQKINVLKQPSNQKASVGSILIRTSTTNTVKSIGILKSIPRTLCGAVIAHELAHAYLTLEHFKLNNSSQLALIEGICELFASIWLSHIHTQYSEEMVNDRNKDNKAERNENSNGVVKSDVSSSDNGGGGGENRIGLVSGSDAELFLTLQQNNKDEVYGDGFRKVSRSYMKCQLPLPVFLKHIQETSSLP